VAVHQVRLIRWRLDADFPNGWETRAMSNGLNMNILTNRAAGIIATSFAVASFFCSVCIGQNNLSDVYKHVSQSVVVIEVYNQSGKIIGQGSGFLVDPAKIPAFDQSLKDLEKRRRNDPRWNEWQTFAVVTNFHVIETAVSAKVLLADGSTGNVHTVAAEDEVDDIAILNVTMRCAAPPSFLDFDKGDVEIGSSVYSIGAPKGQTQFLSSGIVGGHKANSRNQTVDMLHTVPISPGSSGAPLFLENGKVAGVVKSTVVGSQNLNLATPSSSLLRLARKQTTLRPLSAYRSSSVELEITELQIEKAIEILSEDSVQSKSLRSLMTSWKMLLAESDPLEAWDVAHNVHDDTPDEFKWFWHYIMGLSSERIANNNRDVDTYKIAACQYMDCLKLNLDFAPATTGICRTCRHTEDWETMVWAAKILQKQMPFMAEAYQHEGFALCKTKQLSGAKKALARSVELDPKDATAWQLLGNVHLEFGDFELAALAYLSMPADDNENRMKRFWLAGGAFKEGKMYWKAIEIYENALLEECSDVGLGSVFQDMCRKNLVACKDHLNVK
jgi:S1-C subfamily serine protease